MIQKIFSILTIFASIIFITVTSLFAVDRTEPQAMPVIPMVQAMGNAYTAVANDEYAVFYNPAGYATITEGVITVFSLGIKANIDDAALRLYNALLSGKNITSGSNMTTYLSNVTVAPAVAGPVYFGRVGNNFGFAFYDNVSVTLATQPGAIFPSASFHAYSDIGFVGGYAVQLPFYPKLYVGGNLKVLLRIKSQINGTVIAVIDSVSDSSQIPLAKAVGFGSDLGILYKPLSWLTVGVTATDFFGTRFSSWEILNRSSETFSVSAIKPRIPIGIAINPLVTLGESTLFSTMTVSVEYADLLDYSSVLSNIRFGLSFNTLKIITLRAGLNGGYLSGGIGFNLKPFHLDLAYFVEELGAYPGSRPVQNLMLNFAVKW